MSLEVTLQRIQEIQNKFAQAQLSSAPPSQSFESVLNQAQEKSGMRKEIEEIIEKEASGAGIDPSLVKAVVNAESGFNPAAVSPAGAQGLMQLMPGTANLMGVHNTFNPVENIKGGTKYLKGLLQKYQSTPMALAAYNAGPGAVDKYQGIPPYRETQNYVNRVLSLQHEFEEQEGGGS